MLIEFGKFPGYTSMMKWSDIKLISKYSSYCLSYLKDDLESLADCKFKKSEDFISAFFPDTFSDFFSNDLNDFSRSQFMKYGVDDRRSSLAFAVAFWNKEIVLNKIKKNYLPPNAINPEKALENMMSFLIGMLIPNFPFSNRKSVFYVSESISVLYINLFVSFFLDSTYK